MESGARPQIIPNGYSGVMDEDAPRTFEVTQFTCPRCGSHSFEQNPMRGSGLCHGFSAEGKPCSFRFLANDPRYFKGTGRFLPRTVVGRRV